ncbi:hypothetical protein DY000_02063987 [Brassica cretica]|uniref:Uncharacterized protein n=1 Tax=Brassica cretica TaxID=69181 RepID=A0ABQ7AXI9_BRACR|nr:hypothetical protein DY000_02063987 [Brassica cretica]
MLKKKTEIDIFLGSLSSLRESSLSNSLPLLLIKNLLERVELVLRVRETVVFCSPVSVSSDRLQILAFSHFPSAMDGWFSSLGCGGFLSSVSPAYDSASRSFGVDGGSSPGLSRFR